MHFIGRKMVEKGWLAAAELPPLDSLRVELRGPAHAVLAPADSLSSPRASHADTTSI